MRNFETIIDFGSKNLRIGVFDKTLKNIYSSSIKLNNSLENSELEKSLNTLIRDAEKNLSTHIENVLLLYDSKDYYSLDISIKKIFDHGISIKKLHTSLLEEASFIVSQNNFNDQIIHLNINNIIFDDNKELDEISEDFKVTSLILEIKFIFLRKALINKISNLFNKNNLKISNLYCSSYVKTFTYRKKFNKENFLIFLDIGHERSSSLIFNNNKLKYFKSIPLGGYNITKDISKVLKLDLDYSENLKIKFNNDQTNSNFNKKNFNNINIFSELLEKNISADILKQIVEARVKEILELAVYQNNYINNLMPKNNKLIFIGEGSRLSSILYNFYIKRSAVNLIFFDENDEEICRSGLIYHKSDESFHTQIKKKAKKTWLFCKIFLSVF